MHAGKTNKEEIKLRQALCTQKKKPHTSTQYINIPSHAVQQANKTQRCDNDV